MPDVREKLVELLGNLFCGYYGMNGCDGCNYNTEVQCNAYACADRMIANSITIRRWIPVTERKPQEFVSVLIYAPGEVPLPAAHEAYFARGCWVTHITVLNEHEVTHWMEMPELPKMEV